MTEESLASRVFSLEDQRAFAKLSSDYNPMHLDRSFARRTQVGAPVVHGIHTLAWAANAVLHAFPVKVANIRARFLQPLYLDERVGRQLLHVTFGSVLTQGVDSRGKRFKDAIMEALERHADLHQDCLEKHLGKHLSLLNRG